jgi:hypothetical protein
MPSNPDHFQTHAQKRADWRRIVSPYVSTALFISYLVLPGVSTVVFGAFGCVNIDPEGLLSTRAYYLKRDYSISCDSDRYRVHNLP